MASIAEAATVWKTAMHFGVSPRTVRRWIAEGCPCVRPGESGRNKGALLDLNHVAIWRAERLGFTPPDHGLDLIEQALVDVLRRDSGSDKSVPQQIGISTEQAAELLSHALRRIARNLKGTETGHE